CDRIEEAGYSCKTYDIITQDGYGLQVFRVGNSTGTIEAAPAVLLMHGLSSCSDAWVIEGLPNPLAYELVDRGYDVWLGNSRGNTYGSRHLNMTPDDRQFWRFSFHEIGTIDLPQTIDFILEQTQQTALHYVGHSQGSTIAFVLLSMRPEYNEKFKSLNMLAQAVYVSHIKSLVAKYSSIFVGKYTPLQSFIGDTAFFGQPILRQLLGFENCRSKDANPKLCAFLIQLVFGGNSAYLEKALLPNIFNTHPSTSSMHQLMHFVQMYTSQQFRQYDVGPEGNLKRYNQSTPPEYDLSNVNPRFPIHLFYSDYDELSSKTDAENLSQVLGNKSVSHFIDLEQFAHMDFVWASNIKQVINQPVIEIINEVENFLRNEVKDSLESIEVR
uniref:Lipase n=1 Tax=Stomoxys calcitrans TaxID=35570 RepID=A0A1I8NU42_STOCA